MKAAEPVNTEEQTDAPAAINWRENYAYTLDIQAYIFAFPYVYLPSLRWFWVTQPKPPGSITPYALDCRITFCCVLPCNVWAVSSPTTLPKRSTSTPRSFLPTFSR